MKIKQLLRLSAFLSLLLLISCLSDSTVSNSISSSDAQITAFSLLANDTVMKNLNKVFFTIDQNSGEIYNQDSLPVGTKVKRTLKVQMSVASASKIWLEYALSDKVDFSKSNTVDFTRASFFRVTAMDGVTEKLYSVKINVHNQKPDSLVWIKQPFTGWESASFELSKTVLFAGNFLHYLKTSTGFSLYKSASSDGLSWAPLAQDLPVSAKIESLTACMGKLYVGTTTNELYSSADGSAWQKVPAVSNLLALVGSLTDQDGVERLLVLLSDGSVHFSAISNSGALISCGDAVLPDDFPVSGFATLHSTIGLSEKLTLVGGRDKNGNLLNSVQQVYWDRSGFHSAYNIENGSSWFKPREAANAFYYDNKMVVSCGKGATTDFKDVYTSADNGLSWSLDTVHIMPKLFVARSNSSVVVDSHNYIWIFGGLTNFTDPSHPGIAEIWKGRLNRLGFVRP